MNPGPVLQVDMKGNVIMSNSVAKGIFGDKLKICCWQDICPGIDKNTWNNILKAQIPTVIERNIGDTPYIFNHCFDADSGQVFVFGTDVTEQKNAEKAFRESTSLLRLLLDSTVEGIYGIDLDGICTFANMACVKLLGYNNVEALYGQQMYRLVHRAGSDGKIYAYEESRIYKALLRKEGVNVNGELMVRKDNSTFPVEYWSHPIQQENKLIGCVVTFIDVTNRREVEKLQSDYTSALAEVARFPEMNPGPVLRINISGKIIMANQAAHKIFNNPINRLWQDICPGINTLIWKKITKTKTIVIESQIENLDYVFTHRRDFDGNSIFVFGSNITEQKQAERSLQQSEKMASLGKLSAGLAHELNNPAAAAGRSGDQLSKILDVLQAEIVELTKSNIDHEIWILLCNCITEFRNRLTQVQYISPLEISDREEEILTWLQEHGIENSWEMTATMVKFCVLQKDLDEISSLIPPDSIKATMKWLFQVLTAYELTDNIVTSAHKISDLVNMVKSYSHIDSAPQKYVDVHIGLDDTISILSNFLHEGIEIIREYDPDLPLIRVQGSELNQVWTNIIENAIFALNSQGRIVIKTFRQKNWLVVQIKDTGPGIPENIQSKIFDPFFTTKYPGEGTGLGLHICHNIIVQKHKGRLSVHSVPGETCFEIKIPVTNS